MAKQAKQNKKIEIKAKVEITKSEGLWASILAKDNRINLVVFFSAFIGVIAFLKLYYPYPAFESDSGNYVLSATTGKINGYRPFGYSSFLSFINTFSKDIQFVVTAQWFLSMLASFFLVFSLRYIFKLKNYLIWIITACLAFNPSLVFMNSYVMSDGFFSSLTILYITTGLLLAYRKSYLILAIHLFVMYWCFHTRYIALYFPFFTAGIILISFIEKRMMAIGLAIVPLFLVWFYSQQTKQEMVSEFGVNTFSAFSGWQKANNGVAVLPFEKVDTSKIKDKDVLYVHNIVRAFPDSFFSLIHVLETNFMWRKDFPGKAVLFDHIQKTQTPYMRSWAYVGTLLSKYGDYLQSEYRSTYIKKFIVPNSANLFHVFPIDEKKEFIADQNTKNLFETKVEKYIFEKQFFTSLTNIRQIAEYIAWVLFSLAAILLLFFYLKSKKYVDGLKSLILPAFVVSFCIVSVYAAPINNFRYMMPIWGALISTVAFAINLLLTSKEKKQKTND
jgi:hypothetical protein